MTIWQEVLNFKHGKSFDPCWIGPFLISDLDICIFTKVVVTSTYLYFGDFTCILNVSLFSQPKIKAQHVVSI